MDKIVECVPNFSEGRDMKVIEEIINVIKEVEDVYVLDVDPGEALLEELRKPRFVP